MYIKGLSMFSVHCREPYWGAVKPGRNLTLIKDKDKGMIGKFSVGQNLMLGYNREVG